VGLDIINKAPEETATSYLASPTAFGIRGANIQAAGAHNRKIILRAIRALDAAEHASLAEATGLTQPAVFKIVKDLIREGLVISPKTRQGAKGQPAAVLAINPDYAFSIGLNVESDNLVMVVVDFAGRVRGHRRLGGARPSRPGLRRFFANCIDDFLDDHAFDASKIVSVGMASADRSMGSQAPGRSQGTGGTPLLQNRLDMASSELAALIGTPVRAEDRAAAAAHAEVILGAVKTPDPIFYLHLSDQLSGVLIVDQHVVRGDPEHRNAPAVLPQLNPFRSSRTDLGKMLGETVSVSAFLQFLKDRGHKVARLDDIDLADVSVAEAVDEWVNGIADLLYMPLLSMFCCLSLSSVRIGGALPHTVVARLCHVLCTRLSLNLGLNWPEMAVRPATLDRMAPAVGAALIAFGDRWEPAR
jgi:predicted NBD/HSP70 family sugar kinase